MDKPKVYLAFPVYNRVVDMEILSLVFHMTSLNKYQLYMEMMCGPYIDTARNKMAEDFLKTDFEWLYFWDTDVVIRDPEFLDKLLETADKLNAPVVAIPYKLKNSTGTYVTLKKVGNQLVNMNPDDLDKPQLVTATSTGAMLIHRSVLEEMERPFFQISPKMGGKEMPEDYYFCFKAQNMGYNVAVDPRIDNYHFGPASWDHVFKEGQEKVEEAPEETIGEEGKFKKTAKKINIMN